MTTLIYSRHVTSKNIFYINLIGASIFAVTQVLCTRDLHASHTDVVLWHPTQSGETQYKNVSAAGMLVGPMKLRHVKLVMTWKPISCYRDPVYESNSESCKNIYQVVTHLSAITIIILIHMMFHRSSEFSMKLAQKQTMWNIGRHYFWIIFQFYVEFPQTHFLRSGLAMPD